MTSLKKVKGTITNIIDLTPTCKEFTITLSEPVDFIAGCFFNLFIQHNGETIRRAFSVSSSDSVQDTLAFAIRLSLQGVMSPILWNENYVGREIEVMGPLGQNTADKMTREKIYLFGFGVGAGVVKSLAEHHCKRKDMKQLVVITGNRSEDEIIYRAYFDALKMDARVRVAYVVSQPTTKESLPVGYIQNHIANYDFNDADVFVCGQVVACDALVAEVKTHAPTHCRFFVEDFH